MASVTDPIFVISNARGDWAIRNRIPYDPGQNGRTKMEREAERLRNNWSSQEIGTTFKVVTPDEMLRLGFPYSQVR